MTEQARRRKTARPPQRSLLPARTPQRAAARITKRDLVAATLRTEISAGKLPPGAPLFQQVVASRLGVSPTPVREAFGVLALEGFVEWDAYRGVTVSRKAQGVDRLSDLLELRGHLEVIAVRRGVQVVDEALLGPLKESEATATEARALGDSDQWRQARSRFHQGLVALARSDLFDQLMGILLRRSLYFPNIERAAFQGDHAAILAALEAGDIARSVNLVAAHARANVEMAKRAPSPTRKGRGPSALASPSGTGRPR